MKAKRIGYWVTLALFCLAMAGGGVADLMHSPDIMESMTRLGLSPPAGPNLAEHAVARFPVDQTVG